MSDRVPETLTGEDVSHAEMVRFFGGGYQGSRAANSLYRNGIRSMGELSALLDTVGEQGLVHWLTDLRQVGNGLRSLILRGLERYRAERGIPPSPPVKAGSPLRNALPPGFVDRLARTRLHALESTTELGPGGLTHEDLWALHNLLDP